MSVWMRTVLGVWAIATAVAAVAQPAPACPTMPQIAQDRESITARMKAAVDRGFLFALEKDGRTSHLFGTMHVGNPDTLFLGPKAQAAYMGAQVLAVEVNLLDPQVGASIGPMMTSQTPTVVLTPEQAKTMAGLIQAACLPAALKQAMPQMHPNLQLTNFMMSDYEREGYFAAYGSELYLIGMAMGMKRRVVELEKIGDQMSLLKGRTSAEAQKNFDKALAQIAGGSDRRKALKMLQAWTGSDFESMRNFEAWCECTNTPEERAAMKALNDDRNPGLAEGIAKLHAGERVFAAVGALHLFGPRSVQSELEKMGFKVSRIHPAP
jgi:uncharacterized protein